MGCLCDRSQTQSRNISFDTKDNIHYPDNCITTTKYNIITFLPKATLLQFTRLANAVFLVIAIIQSIPVISSLHPATAIAPFLFVIVLALFREAYQDYKRYRNDKEINQKSVLVLKDKEFVKSEWQKVVVGDIVKIQEDEMVPADLVLLYSTQENSICYVETANLDGQTNLKTKNALHESISEYPQEFGGIQGQVIVEAPNSNLHEFYGELGIKGKEKQMINFVNLLVRGTMLRNTAYVAGIVVYAGHSTKIMQNNSDIHHKVSHVELKVNKIQVFLLIILTLLSLGCSIGYYQYHTQYGNGTRQQIWYLRTSNVFNMTFQSFLIFFTSFLLLSFLIPISMNVSLEAVKAFQGIFLSFDKNMYYQPIDKFCGVQNMSIIEELGLVDYVLTDKTGTLTANQMKFQYVWINGKTYTAKQLTQNFQNKSAASPHEQQFWISVIICHDIVVDAKKNQFQGSSPDQVCFVDFAHSIGYTFLKRTKNSIELKVNGKKHAFQFLFMIPFTSRKRMSVIIKNLQTQEIFIHTKGADSAILQKAKKQNHGQLNKSLQKYSKEGLRTLVFSCRKVSEQQFNKFMEKVKGIQNEKIVKAKNLEEIEQMQVDMIEQMQFDLTVIGASAIEDRLQDGVPETISRLEEAGIKVMMITGDKLETAENIGYLSSFIDENSSVWRIRPGHDLAEQVKQILSKIEQNMDPKAQNQSYQMRQIVKKENKLQQTKEITEIRQLKHHSIVEDSQLIKNKKQKNCVLIEGEMISKFTDQENFIQDYAKLLKLSNSVIFCRSTPKEKAKIVKFVKERLHGIVLAIGDGGNDVGMIEVADIGIGLAGKEGNQASTSSDFNFGQFRFLDRLLLHHGRWCYYRVSYFFVYYGWKNMIMTLLIFYFMIDSAYSGFPSFSEIFISLYNAVIGLFLLLEFSVLDQDINDDLYRPAFKLLPQFYKEFKKMNLFSYKRIIIWFVLGVILSVFYNFILNLSLNSTQLIDSAGHTGDFKAEASAGAIGLSFAVILVLLVDINNFTCCTFFFSITLFTVILCSLVFIVENFVDLGTVTGSLTDNTGLRFYATIILIAGFTFAIKYFLTSFQFMLQPNITEKIMMQREKQITSGVIRPTTNSHTPSSVGIVVV